MRTSNSTFCTILHRQIPPESHSCPLTSDSPSVFRRDCPRCRVAAAVARKMCGLGRHTEGACDGGDRTDRPKAIRRHVIPLSSPGELMRQVEFESAVADAKCGPVLIDLALAGIMNRSKLQDTTSWFAGAKCLTSWCLYSCHCPHLAEVNVCAVC